MMDGVFAGGGATDGDDRQTLTAAGTGAMTTLETERWLAYHGLAGSPVLETAEAPVRQHVLENESLPV